MAQPAYFNLRSPFTKATGISTKSHTYETLTDLNALSASQIIKLDPSKVGFHILSRPGTGAPLSRDKLAALNTLLKIKTELNNVVYNNDLGRKCDARQLILEDNPDIQLLQNNLAVAQLLGKTKQEVDNDKIEEKKLASKYNSTFGRDAYGYNSNSGGGKSIRKSIRKSRKHKKHKKSKKSKRKSRKNTKHNKKSKRRMI
jgi:hypothetical protein